MREKAKADGQYRDRLLKYISHLVTETLPSNISDEDAKQFGDRVFGSRAFAPFPLRHPMTLNYKNNWISTTSCYPEICTQRATLRLVSSTVIPKSVAPNSHDRWWGRVAWIQRQA